MILRSKEMSDPPSKPENDVPNIRKKGQIRTVKVKIMSNSTPIREP